MKNRIPQKTDDFAMDVSENGTRKTYDNVAEGDIYVQDQEPVTPERFAKEQDIPSIFLRGVVPGATSADKSEDPNFRPIRNAIGPEGVNLTQSEIEEVQISSLKRYKTDTQYNAIIDCYKVFVIGKGIHITPKDESEEVNIYLNEFMKLNRMDGLDREIVEEFMKTGEVFIRKFTKNNPRSARIPAIRMLRFYEIEKIIYDKNGEPISYIRPYTEQDDVEVKREEIPADDMIHIKYGDQKRGLPPFMVTMMHCAYYDDWLFNRIVFNRLKTAYYLEEIVDGSAARVSTADQAIPDAVKTGQRGKVIKRTPKPGSKITHNKAIEYKWLKPEVNAEDAKEDGRAIRMAICAGAKCPEFVLGDASQSNYASTLVSQNPFVRNVEWFQDFLASPFEEIHEWAIGYGIDNKFLPSQSMQTVAKEKVSSLSWFRRVPRLLKAAISEMFIKEIQSFPIGKKLHEQVDNNGNFVTRMVIKTNREVTSNWPNLIAQDLLKDSQAYQIHQSMGIVSNETIAQKLGYNWHDEKEKIEREDLNHSNDEFDDETKKRDEEINQGSDDEED